MRVTERGNWNVICKVCGFQYKASETKTRWDGLQPVCKECFETRHPMDLYRGRADNPSVPFISKDAVNYSTGMLAYDHEPSATSVSTFAGTFGNCFLALEDLYASNVRIWHGKADDDGSNRGFSVDPVWLSLWNNDTSTLMWSTRTTIQKTGQWFSVPITPNQTLVDGTTYIVAVTTVANRFTYETPRPSVDTQTYCDYIDSMYTLGGTTPSYPTNSDLGNLYLIDIETRTR